jgi:hypothetical protein
MKISRPIPSPILVERVAVGLRSTALTLAFAAILVLSAVRAPAAIDFRGAFDVRVTLTQAVLCDGSVRLAPGAYDVHVKSAGDGSVRAGFFQGGVKKGESRGIIAVRKASTEKSPSLASLGFSSNSPSSLRPDGQKLSLEIGAPGSNQILIGLLVPAVQK